MSIEPPRDQWQPTMHLRWNLGGKLQQMWWREVDEYSTFWKRTLWKPEYEWRDIPTAQPTQETGACCDGKGAHSLTCPNFYRPDLNREGGRDA